MPASRRTRAARRAACLLLVTAALAGCGDDGRLRGAGATPTAISPARLWPELTPASSPAFDLGEVDTEVVEGVAVPGGDIRAVDPVAVVRAEIAAHPEDYEGDGAPFRETARRMADCVGGPESAEPGGRQDDDGCPVLEPYYRDLTGDSRPELTLGFRLLPEKLTAVRVYTAGRNRLTRIMAYDDALSGVELARRSVIIRSPSEVAGYEYRLQWTWDPDQRAMLLTHDEMLRTGTPARPGSSRSPRPSAPASPAPSKTPEPSRSSAPRESPEPGGLASARSSQPPADAR
ncbi:hypothetical protein [Streptomyces sp. NPDC029526]|uniref:hypothetical protein n=1 Tax=Streptomyces sp. NPDC029526 TaxID=3155728 RepID=UPI0034087A41